jgi:hypothetical protein
MINKKFAAIVLAASIPVIISIAAGQGLDAAGSWKQTTQGLSESSVWNITWDQTKGVWEAKEQGLGGAEGTATLTNNVLVIKWTTPNNWAGYYKWTLDPTGTSGTGELVWTKQYGNQVNQTLQPSTVTRISGPPSNQSVQAQENAKCAALEKQLKEYKARDDAFAAMTQIINEQIQMTSLLLKKYDTVLSASALISGPAFNRLLFLALFEKTKSWLDELMQYQQQIRGEWIPVHNTFLELQQQRDAACRIRSPTTQ